ncbi:hypothetical protein C5B94_03975 [Clavibacter michiganensis]|uniref:DUF6093 family protein n=1 Tax=Clavibacter michiganensis TaxID=28447 RepID=UPI000CE8C609|nr:DUF6093 family protein [Clavibacter michiganensis]PPF56087.1 hypothetical protein C5B94_03975 [Clavibacter michiganensis]
MPSASQLARARRAVEAQMTDTCRIVGTTRSAQPDPDTGKHTVTELVAYEGPCQFVAANTAVRVVEAAGQQVVLQGAVLKVPVKGSERVRDGHTATITYASHDDQMATVKVRIEGTHHQTSATARRFPVKESP